MSPINWHTFFFLLFSLLAGGFALAVVFSSHIVRMAFYLVMSLGATAGLFFLAGADFVGAMQLLIYVGGTLVLLIFGVMLTAQGPFVSMKTGGGDWVLTAIMSGVLLAFLIPTAFSVPSWRNEPGKTSPNIALDPALPPTDVEATNTADRVGLALVGVRVDKLEDGPASLKRGMSSYFLPFEIVSVHLLVVLIGAAYLARTKRRADAPVLSE